MRIVATSSNVRYLSSTAWIKVLALLPLVLAGVLLRPSVAHAVQIQNRSLKLQSSLISANNTYELSFTHQTTTSIGSIRIQFCDNDPLIGQPCSAPSGFSLTSASLAAQTGMTGFSIDPASTIHELLLTRVSAINPAPIPTTFTLTNIQNPDTEGTYFVRVESFASTNATGPNIDYGGIAFRINGGLNIQTEVPPFLLFCAANTIQSYDCGTATGNYVDFGDFSTSRTVTGQTQVLVATNAEFGYTIRTLGTTLTSGINTIPALATQDVSRTGVGQFGMNVRANSTPPVGNDPQGPGSGSAAAQYNTPNYYKFVPGDVIISWPTTDSYRQYTITYIVNISSTQPPGIYVSTLQYVALASF